MGTKEDPTGTGYNWTPAGNVAIGALEVVNIVSGVIDAAADKTITAMTSKFSVRSGAATGSNWKFEVYASVDGADETKLVATSTTHTVGTSRFCITNFVKQKGYHKSVLTGQAI